MLNYCDCGVGEDVLYVSFLSTDGSGKPGETEGSPTGESDGEKEEGTRAGETGKEAVLPQEV